MKINKTKKLMKYRFMFAYYVERKENISKFRIVWKKQGIGGAYYQNSKRNHFQNQNLIDIWK